MIKGWALTNKQWKTLLISPHSDFTQLNQWWHIDYSHNTWIRLWKKVWGCRVFHHDMILLWRIFNHGLFTHRRAQVRGVNNGVCPCCFGAIETINHLFFGCRNVRHRWGTLGVLLTSIGLERVFTGNSLWEILKSGVMRARRIPLPLIILAEMVSSIWCERNMICYRGSCTQIPLFRLLLLAANHSKALMNMCNNAKNHRLWVKELESLYMATNQPIPFTYI